MAPRRARADWIEIVEAAYDLEVPSHDAWLARLTSVVAPHLNPVNRATSCLFHLEADTLQAFAFAGSDQKYLERAMAIGLSNPELFKRCYQGRTFDSMSTHIGRANMARWTAYNEAFAAIGEADAVGLVARDGGPWGVCMVGGQPEVRSVTQREARPWNLIAAHIHAALRLRFRLHGMPDVPESTSGIELHVGIDAVLSPSGKVEHLEPSARHLHDALRRAATAMERARGRLRRDDPFRALESWRALVDGELSLVDVFENDGRRYLVARRNPPDGVGLGRISEREQRVLGLRVRGHGLKVIAYELGLSSASVSRALQSAMRKLGLRSISDLGSGAP